MSSIAEKREQRTLSEQQILEKQIEQLKGDIMPLQPEIIPDITDPPIDSADFNSFRNKFLVDKTSDRDNSRNRVAVVISGDLMSYLKKTLFYLQPDYSIGGYLDNIIQEHLLQYRNLINEEATKRIDPEGIIPQKF